MREPNAAPLALAQASSSPSGNAPYDCAALLAAAPPALAPRRLFALASLKENDIPPPRCGAAHVNARRFSPSRAPLPAALASPPSKTSVCRASGMRTGSRRSGTHGKRALMSAAIHRLSNCADSPAAPVGCTPSMQSEKLPALDASCWPKLEEPARSAYIVASTPCGQSCDMMTTLGMYVHRYVTSTKASLPMTNASSRNVDGSEMVNKR